MGLSRIPSFSDRPGFPSGLRVLAIDGDAATLQGVLQQLESCQYAAQGCTTIEEAVSLLSSSEEPVDTILCEASFATPEVLSMLSERSSAAALIVMGADIGQARKLTLLDAGVVDFLEKPLSFLKLRNVWQHTVRKMLKGRGAAGQASASQDGDGDAGAHHSAPLLSSAPPLERHVAAETNQGESTGSSSAEPSPQSATTAVDGAANGQAVVAAPPTRTKARSRDRGAVGRGSRSLRSSIKPPLRACVSQDGKEGPARRRPPPRSASAAVVLTAAAPAPRLHQAASAGSLLHAQSAPAPLPRALTPVPSVHGGPPQYSLQGMPMPLPGCVWGLPMLPPPVPGLMSAPVMMPAPSGGAPWYGGAPPAAGKDTSLATAAAPSFGGWSADAASTETGLPRSARQWANTDPLPLTSDGAAADIDAALRHLSDDLLDIVPAQGGREAGMEAGMPPRGASLHDLLGTGGDRLADDTLDWIDSEFVMDEALIDEPAGAERAVAA